MTRYIYKLLIVAVLSTFGLGIAGAGTLPNFTPQQLQIPQTAYDFNALVQAINNNVVLNNAMTLAPLPGGGSFMGALQVPASSTNGSTNAIANGIQIIGAVSGQAPIIQSYGTDANVGLILNMQGLGLLQFANIQEFVPLNSFVACPGYVQGGANPVGLSPTVTGYWVFVDFRGQTHRVPSC